MAAQFFILEAFGSGDRVPDNLPFIEVNHVFSNVGGQVGDPFEVSGDVR